MAASENFDMQEQQKGGGDAFYGASQLVYQLFSIQTYLAYVFLPSDKGESTY